MWHGILIVNKERGLTSHQVVAELRRILRQSEIGHTGTLDPEATGVLVVGLGQATRSFSFLAENIKVYQAEIILGQTTDSYDATGKIVTQNLEMNVTAAELIQAVSKLTGSLQQLPPMFSAVKIQGKKLYDLARMGLTVERQERPIVVHSWKLFDEKYNYSFRDRFESEIVCSKGTYIRALINDLGMSLGCGAHMGRLIRLASGEFSLANAVTLAQVKEFLADGCLAEIILPMNVALKHLPAIELDEVDLVKIKNGGKISYYKYHFETKTGTLVRVLDQLQKVVAVARLENGVEYQYWQPLKVFK